MWEPDFTILPLAECAPPAACAPLAECAALAECATLAAPAVPPKRPRLHTPERRVPPVVPYYNRPVVFPLPRDPCKPFRHVGLMREIGGARGFMSVVRGTHRFPDGWEHP